MNMEKEFFPNDGDKSFWGKIPSPTAVYHVVIHLTVKSAGAVPHDAYKLKSCSMRKIFGTTLANKMFTRWLSTSTPKTWNKDFAWV